MTVPKRDQLLEVEQVRDGGSEVISARGEIDISTAPLLSEALQTAVQRGAGPVVVDLNEVSFMDSTGLHILLNALRRLTRQHRRLSIACSENGRVYKVLALANLVGTFSVHPSRRSALGDEEKLITQRWRPSHVGGPSDSGTSLWPAPDQSATQPGWTSPAT